MLICFLSHAAQADASDPDIPDAMRIFCLAALDAMVLGASVAMSLVQLYHYSSWQAPMHCRSAELSVATWADCGQLWMLAQQCVRGSKHVIGNRCTPSTLPAGATTAVELEGRMGHTHGRTPALHVLLSSHELWVQQASTVMSRQKF